LRVECSEEGARGGKRLGTRGRKEKRLLYFCIIASRLFPVMHERERESERKRERERERERLYNITDL